MVDSDHLVFVHVRYVVVFFCTCIYSLHFVHIVMKFEETYPIKFEPCICVQLWEIICVPCINFNIGMLHFVLFHNVTHYTNSLLSRILINTT